MFNRICEIPDPGGGAFGTERTERTDLIPQTGGVQQREVIGKSALRAIMILARKVKFSMTLQPYEVKPFVRDWHQRSRYASIEFVEVWHEFQIAFKAAMYPIGVNVAAQAAQNPKPLPVFAGSYSENIQKVMGLCFTMAMADPRHDFFLACREPERQLGIPFRSALRIMKELVADGILICLDKGQKGKKGRAARYRWAAPVV